MTDHLTDLRAERDRVVRTVFSPVAAAILLERLVSRYDTACTALAEKAAKYDAINTPEIEDFITAVRNEALHQRERWGTEHDSGKKPADWLWLLGYLAGKALHALIAGDLDKAKHHIITSAAACLNWHAHVTGAHTAMRPGTAQPKETA